MAGNEPKSPREALEELEQELARASKGRSSGSPNTDKEVEAALAEALTALDAYADKVTTKGRR